MFEAWPGVKGTPDTEVGTLHYDKRRRRRDSLGHISLIQITTIRPRQQGLFYPVTRGLHICGVGTGLKGCYNARSEAVVNLRLCSIGIHLA